jgi:hypothetical protein
MQESFSRSRKNNGEYYFPAEIRIIHDTGEQQHIMVQEQRKCGNPRIEVILLRHHAMYKVSQTLFNGKNDLAR